MATYDIVFIEGLRPSQRRGVVLLSCEGDTEIDAVATFRALDENRDRELRQRFDAWIENAQHNNRWFHGFDRPEYKECFVFKWKQKNNGHRLYGFLCHPYPQTNRRFWLCVLTNHAMKPLAQWETDPLELDKANGLRLDRHVQAVIQMRFPDHSPRTKPCLN